MAHITAEDILQKKFKVAGKNKGYDEVEVDDFLDEIVASMTALESQIRELTQAQLATPPLEAPVFAPLAPEVPVVEATPEPSSEPQAATALLMLATQMHDEHVAAGLAKAEALVREAQEASDRQLGDLETQRAELTESVSELREFEARYRAGVRQQLEHLITLVGDSPAVAE